MPLMSVRAGAIYDKKIAMSVISLLCALCSLYNEY